MHLHLRLALLISLIFALLAVSLFLVFNFAVMHGYQSLEQQDVTRNVARVHETMAAFQQDVALKAEEWGAWDDTYHFMDDRNEAYSSSNLSFGALSQLQLSHFVIVDRTGNLHTGLTVDADNVSAELSDSFLGVFRSLAMQSIELEEPISSLSRVNNELYIIGAAPVTDSTAEAPVKGAILFTRLFDEEFHRRLEEITRIETAFLEDNSSLEQLELQQIEEFEEDFRYGSLFLLFDSGTVKTGAVKAGTVKTGIVQAFSTLTDYAGDHVAIVRTSQSRDLMAKGIETRNLVTLFILLFSFVALAASLLFLRRWVIRPIQSLAKQSISIGQSRSYGERVLVAGDIEIQDLAQSLNRMMDDLEDANSSVLSARDEARAANFSKSIFIARVSHELRNPVGGILGINRMLSKRPDISDASKELLSISSAAATNMVSIINEILDFSKIESGELNFDSAPFSLRTLLKETMQVISGRLAMSEEEGEEKNVKLLLDVPPSLPDTWNGDANRLRQVLINLAGNSLKFTNSGYVGVRVRMLQPSGSPARLSFSIWDTGSGISKEKQSTVFEPFKHANEGNLKAQGTGLGLAIVREFVRKFGGEVKLKSRPEAGSVFRFSVPLQSLPTENETEAAWRERSGALRLISGDSKETRVLKRGVEATGWALHVLDTLTEQESPATLESQNTDSERWLRVALTDPQPIVITGKVLAYEWVWQILQQRNESIQSLTPHTIAILEPAEIGERDRLYELGIRSVVTAPVIADELLAMATERVVSQPETAIQVASPTGQALLQQSRKLRVLIADDALTNRLVLEDMLLEAGHDVVCVKDGEELLALAEPAIDGSAAPFDLIITDVTMPKIDGCEATKRIREKSAQAHAHVPIIAVTAHALSEEQDKIRAAGVDGVVCKPVSPESLWATIGSVLRKEELRDIS